MSWQLACSKQAGSATGPAAESASQHVPLQAASWTALALDLCSRGWSDGLIARGFEPQKPTVWVLEGLLMYLSDRDVQTLLQEIAGRWLGLLLAVVVGGGAVHA